MSTRRSPIFLVLGSLVAFACAGGELEGTPNAQGTAGGPGTGGAGGGSSGAGGSNGGAAGKAGTAGVGGQAAGKAGAAGASGAGAGGASGGAGGAAPGLGLDNAPAAATLGTLSFAAATTNVIVAGPFALAVHPTGVGVLDLTNPAAPKEASTITTGAQLVAADYDEATGALFLLDKAGTLQIVRLFVADAPSVLSQVTGLPANATGLARVGSRVFVAATGTLVPVTLGGGAQSPTLTLGTAITLPKTPTHLAGGSAALFLGFSGGRVESWSTGALPAITGSIELGGDLGGLVAKGAKIIALPKTKGLRVVDFATPAVPAIVYQDAELHDAFASQLQGRALVVGLDRKYVSVLDLSDFTRPRAVTTNKGTLPAWVAVADGNLVFGSGLTGTVASIPPFVAGRVPAITWSSFPRNGTLPLTFHKPIDPASAVAGAVTLTCAGAPVEGAIVVSPDALRVTFRPNAPLPAAATCTLDFSKLKGKTGGDVSSAAGGKQSLTTAADPPAPFVQPKSAYPHGADGKFTDWKNQSGGQYEWFDVKPAKGMYTYFYADFDGSKLWILNDWFYGGDDIQPDCYNQFQVWTGGGKERWEIRAYGDQHVEVRKDGVLVDATAAGVQGGSFYGPSPNVAEPHTQYELAIPATAGAWGVQLHDPGPAFQCQKLEAEPSSVVGDSSGASPSVDPGNKVAFPMPPTLVDVTATDLTPTLTWTSTDDWKNFDAYVLTISRDAAGKLGRWDRTVYGPSFTVPPGLLAPATQYYWSVLAYNTAGQRASQVGTFTTAGGQGGQGGGGGAAGNGGAGGASNGNVCVAVNDDGTMAGSVTGTRSIGIQHVATGAQTITGAEIFTGKVQLQTPNVLALYSDVGGKPGSALGTGSFVPGQATGWYGAAFDKSVDLASGTTYWLVWTPQSGQQSPFTAQGGTKVPYRGSDDLMTWDGPFSGNVKYRLDCASTGSGGSGGSSGSGGSGGSGGAPQACGMTTPYSVCDASPQGGVGSYCVGGVCNGLIHTGETFTHLYALSGLSVTPPQSGTLKLVATLDDHANASNYCLDVSINGTQVGSMVPVQGVPHGEPFGGPFTNFVEWTYPLTQQALALLTTPEITVTLTLGCAGGSDWLVFRQSELTVKPAP